MNDNIKSACDAMSQEPTQSGVGAAGFDIGSEGGGSDTIQGACGQMNEAPPSGSDVGLPLTLTMNIDEGDANLRSASDQTFSQG